MTKIEIFLYFCTVVGLLTILFVLTMVGIYVVRSSWAALVRNRRLEDDNNVLSREVDRLRELLADTHFENQKLRDAALDAALKHSRPPQEDPLS